MPTTAPISETFTSIQGEGKLAGIPSWFCRFSGCNLRCTWCDTPYASWSPDGAQRSLDELLAEARASNARHAVLTGGEPMMFPQLTELSSRLATELGMHITIETAGTIIPPGGMTCHLISISPKLANSTPPARDDPRDPLGIWSARHEQRRLNLPILQQLLDSHEPATAPTKDRQLKFVVAQPSLQADLAEIEQLLAQLRGWKPDDVLLMPEGVSPPAQPFAAAVAAECIRRRWRYCHRLHLDLFGHTRGT